MEKLLPDICRIQYGYAFDSAKFSDFEGVPLIRIRDVVRGFSETYTTEACGAEYIVNDGDMLIGMDGEFNIAHWKGGKAYLNQRVCRLIPSDEVDALYLYYFMPKALKAIEDKTPFVTVKHLSAKELNKVVVPMPSLDEQNKIAISLQKVDELIVLRKEQLAKLDQLVKSRFIELFGDPEHNEKEIPTLPMTELCEIIDGDRGANYPKQEEFSDNGFCLFLNAKNVTANGFSFENCMFITAEKDKLLRKGKLSRGDVVLTTRGTIGNLAFYDGAVPYEHIRINSGMVILRMKRECITERFFIEQFKMQLASIKEKIASGSAQPQLPISTMNKIVMLVPDVELQAQFVAFIEQTDKSKSAIQQSLDKLETLKKALMQKYFG